jgi:2-keto-4-pentenoate hydratase/2-oxohepta-3-ene-1,7-dioic acid hydratase in catechol pathway
MRIARLDTPEGPRYAVWTGHAWEVVADCFSDPPVSTGVSIAPDDAHLLAPCEPRVLIGIAHNKTNNGHVLPIQAWHKSVRSVVSPNAVIQARRDVGTVNIEGELAVVIGRDTAGITVDTAFDYLLGYTVVNDVTNVDRNAIDEKNFEGKGGHGYTPIGPWIETELDDPERAAITVTVNGTVKADSGTFNLPSTVAESIAYVAKWVPLGPGDVIMSGSPNTFVAVSPGDIVEVSVSGIGSLTNRVV